MSTDAIYQGMLEAAEQWNQLLKALEEEIPDSEKGRLIQEFFQLEEGESFLLPQSQTNKKKKRPELLKNRKKMGKLTIMGTNLDLTIPLQKIVMVCGVFPDDQVVFQKLQKVCF